MICPHCGGPVTQLDIEFDYTTGAVVSAGKTVTLPKTLLHIAECLIDAYPRGASAEAIFVEIYGAESDTLPNTLRQNISRLSEAFEKAGFPWEVVRIGASSSGERGAGYALLPRASDHVFRKTA